MLSQFSICMRAGPVRPLSSRLLPHVSCIQCTASPPLPLPTTTTHPNWNGQPHHAAASCPDPPASCTWTDYGSPGPNPQARPTMRHPASAALSLQGWFAVGAFAPWIGVDGCPASAFLSFLIFNACAAGPGRGGRGRRTPPPPPPPLMPCCRC
jgi:hypothetical protein